MWWSWATGLPAKGSFVPVTSGCRNYLHPGRILTHGETTTIRNKTKPYQLIGYPKRLAFHFFAHMLIYLILLKS